jgi:hypothetical protein
MTEEICLLRVTAASSYNLTRLTPGIKYYLIVGRKHDDGIAWSQWAMLTLNDGHTSCPTKAASTPTPQPAPAPIPSEHCKPIEISGAGNDATKIITLEAGTYRVATTRSNNSATM